MHEGCDELLLREMGVGQSRHTTESCRRLHFNLQPPRSAAHYKVQGQAEQKAELPLSRFTAIRVPETNCNVTGHHIGRVDTSYALGYL